MAKHVDILIVGGGLAGASMAIAADKAGLSWIAVDKADLPATLEPDFDGRVTAIAYGSYAMFDTLGIWQHISEPNPIDDIHVSDEGSPFFLHFDHREVGNRPFGFMVENRQLRYGLGRALEDCVNGEMFSGTEIMDLERQPASVVAKLSNGLEVRAPLVIGADGRDSRMRQDAGIKQIAWPYHQTAIVCVMAHDLPHHNMALEHFLPTGPFALLPMSENRSALVWSESDEISQTMMALDDDEFSIEVMARADERYGNLDLVSKRWSFPMSLANSERYIDHRLALVADAAHAMHPIAGQGLNLGLRDVAALAELLHDAARLGRDLGDPLLLKEYQRWRRFDALTMLLMTDGLNRGFSTDFPPIRVARNLGLGVVQNLPPVKRFFERHAAALTGDLPKLIRGEALA